MPDLKASNPPTPEPGDWADACSEFAKLSLNEDKSNKSSVTSTQQSKRPPAEQGSAQKVEGVLPDRKQGHPSERAAREITKDQEREVGASSEIGEPAGGEEELLLKTKTATLGSALPHMQDAQTPSKRAFSHDSRLSKDLNAKKAQDSAAGGPKASDAERRGTPLRGSGTVRDGSQSAASKSTSPPPSHDYQKNAAPSQGPTTLPCAKTLSKEYDRFSVKYTQKHAKPFEIALKIKDLLKKELSHRNQSSQQVYILEAPEFFSQFEAAASDQHPWIKIGRTGALSKRYKSLRIRCDIKDLSIDSISKPMSMAMIERLEKLCQEQLINFQRKWSCGSAKCETNVHGEWFAVEKAVARRTRDMWVSFLELEPYEGDGILSFPWRMAVDKADFSLLMGEDPSLAHEELHQALEAWIKTTAEGIKKTTESM